MALGKVAVVTGGSGALGRAVVKRLAAGGVRVHVPWIVPAEVPQLKKYLGARASAVRLHETDVTDPAAAERLFQAVKKTDGGLDILAHIVGGFAFGSLEDTSLETFRRMLDLNAVSAFNTCRAAFPMLKRRGGGSVVNVAALPALQRGAAMMSAYAASKAAVLNLTYSLAAEWLPHRITVNAIVPTVIDTPANRKAMPDADTSTWLDPMEIAEVIAFLASDAARIVTGAAVTLSKG